MLTTASVSLIGYGLYGAVCRSRRVFPKLSETAEFKHIVVKHAIVTKTETLDQFYFKYGKDLRDVTILLSDKYEYNSQYVSFLDCAKHVKLYYNYHLKLTNCPNIILSEGKTVHPFIWSVGGKRFASDSDEVVSKSLRYVYPFANTSLASGLILCVWLIWSGAYKQSV